MRQAEIGLKLFKEEEVKEYDLAAATRFKEQQDAKIQALEAEADQLHGKDNMKARAAKGKEAAALKAEPQYIDAIKVVKSLDNFDCINVLRLCLQCSRLLALCSSRFHVVLTMKRVGLGL